MIAIPRDAPGSVACGRSGLPLLAICSSGHRRTVPFRLLKTSEDDRTPLYGRGQVGEQRCRPGYKSVSGSRRRSARGLSCGPQAAIRPPYRRNEDVVSRLLKGTPACSYPIERSIAFNQGAPASRQDGAQLVFSRSSLLDHSHIIRSTLDVRLAQPRVLLVSTPERRPSRCMHLRARAPHAAVTTDIGTIGGSALPSRMLRDESLATPIIPLPGLSQLLHTD